MKIKTLFIWVQILVFISFILISLGMVFSKGICCGDDAFHAVVAKNLADGSGYASTLQANQAEYSLILFDPLLGTGPSIILPAALVIKLVGNTYWAPGVTIVSLWALLLLIIGIYLNRFFENTAHLTLAIITFFFLSYIFMAYHFEHWYALLGEIPAALLIVLAMLVYFDSESKGNLLLTGILFSLAFHAKLIAFLPFASFLLYIILYNFIHHRKNFRQSVIANFRACSLISLGFIIPIVLFEIWKLITLGLTGYVDYWAQYLNFVFTLGVTSDKISIEKIAERFDLIQSRFGVFLPAIFLILIGIGIVVRKDKRVFLLFNALAVTITVYTIYWVIFSNGWARYYIISILFIIIALALPFVSAQIRRSGMSIYVIILVILSFYNAQKINITYPFRDVTLFEPTKNILALNKISNLLSTQIEKRPFVTQWWATAIDLEYILDTHLNFTTYWDPGTTFDKSFIFVANSKFLNEADVQYIKYLERCETRNIGPYVYGECDPGLFP